MNKKLTVILALMLTAVCSCAGALGEINLQSDNEIATYRYLDPTKTQIIISRTGNIDVTDLCESFEKSNPDIQVIYMDITGGDYYYKPLIDWVENGCLPDIIVSTTQFFSEEATVKYFENLSANPIIDNYESAALQRTAINSEIYWLPGPSNIEALMYNKTLFNQYGWEVPTSFDEFVKLCNQIREDTNGEVEPWNPNAKYSVELLIALEAFTYEELFSGLDNFMWYTDLINGEASFAEHMKPYYDVIETLVDNGLLREEHFTYSATARGKEFLSGKIAMVNANIYDADNDAYDFDIIPFPSTTGNIGYVNNSYSCLIGIPKKEHTDNESDAIDRFMRYFSSVEGQQVYIGNSMMVSSIKNMPESEHDELISIEPAIDAGHMFSTLDFGSAKNRTKIVNLHYEAEKMAKGEKTKEECLAELPSDIYSDEEYVVTQDTIAVVKEDMTILETSFYMADMYRDAAGADIGLIAHNIAFRGNLMRMFAGDLTDKMISTFKPRSFSNDSTLIKASMTGRQILDALNAPPDYEDDVSNCIYAYSGLICDVAPCKPLGEKYLSVTLPDGSELDENKLYTVGMWSGTVNENCVTEILEIYESTFEDIMKQKVITDKEICPSKDERIKLIWN